MGQEGEPPPIPRNEDGRIGDSWRYAPSTRFSMVREHLGGFFIAPAKTDCVELLLDGNNEADVVWEFKDFDEPYESKEFPLLSSTRPSSAYKAREAAELYSMLGN